jgi:tetratricopeptide (TPR) repeat protein
MRVLEAARRRRPDAPDAHLRIGVALAQRGDLDGAMAAYREALRLDPRFADAQNNVGVILTEENELEDALAAFRRAAALKPDLIEAQNNVADTLRKLGRLDEALEAVEAAVARAPDEPSLLNTRSLILRRLGRLDEAIESQRRTIDLEPERSSFHNNLGSVLAARGDLDAALAAFDEALRLEPKSAVATANRGNIFARRREWPEALAAFRAAARLDPENPEYPYKIGRVHEQNSRFAEAEAAYRSADEMGHPRAATAAAKCRNWAARIRRIERIVAGEIEPPAAAELLSLARLARFANRHAAAAELWEAAFLAMKPDQRGRQLFEAARSAALAGLGRGRDAARLDEAARGALLDRAAGWVGAYLDGLAAILERDRDAHRASVRRTLEFVTTCRDLAPLRTTTVLATLTAERQHRWLALWTRAHALAARTE